MDFTISLLFPAIVFLAYPTRNISPEKSIAGTWNRYKDQKVCEIFITSKDRHFIADLFDGKGMITGIEKGCFELTGNQVVFRFEYSLTLKNDGTYQKEGRNKLKPVRLPFYRDRDTLIIGSNRYYSR